MRKLKLEVDALAVESFETAPGTAGTGTVRGQALAPGPDNPESRIWSCNGSCVTCTDCNTCISCQVTCFDATCISCQTCATCGESCGRTLCHATFPDNCCMIG
ncbi:MAG TPA: hypothetical protein VEX86_02085 [Longimicrobium sp.]|nr:hypothetical protein [Longimicrobium sp.]